MPNMDISHSLYLKDAFQIMSLLWESHSKKWREGPSISLRSQPRCCINHPTSFRGSLQVLGAFSQDGGNLLNLPSGGSDEVTWTRAGSVVWFWNPADGNSYLPQDLGVWLGWEWQKGRNPIDQREDTGNANGIQLGGEGARMLTASK